MEVTLNSEEETDQWISAFSSRVKPGDHIALIGTLGAGKSFISRSLLRHLGVDAIIPSPTFTLINEYTVPHPSRPFTAYHMDVYRLGGYHEFIDLGAEDYFTSDTLLLIEWADIFEQLMVRTNKKIRISTLPSGARKLRVEGYS